MQKKQEKHLQYAMNLLFLRSCLCIRIRLPAYMQNFCAVFRTDSFMCKTDLI